MRRIVLFVVMFFAITVPACANDFDELIGGWGVEIPMYNGEELGTLCPEDMPKEWSEAQFLYNQKVFDYAQRAFRIENTDQLIVISGGYCFQLIPSGEYGPVFKCISYSWVQDGQPYGVTPNTILFVDGENIYATEGNCKGGLTHKFECLPPEEREGMQKAVEIPLSEIT